MTREADAQRPVRVAIIGGGAMGSVYAGLLASAGNDVLVVDPSEDHVRAINAGGLRVSGASGDRSASVSAFTRVPDVHVDLVIIAVKAGSVARAAASAEKLVGPDALVLTIQNGLGSANAVAAALDPDRLIVGIAQGFGASRPAPGHAHHEGLGAVRMGPYADLSPLAVERVAAVWRAAGFSAEAVRDIAAIQWEKLICNVAYSALCALTGETVGRVLADDELAAVSRAAATEAWRVARGRGIAIDVEDPVAYARDFAARMPDAKPSVLLDVEAGRPSEIDVINGAVPREAERVGMSAPVNATLTHLVKALEQRGASVRQTDAAFTEGFEK